MSGILENKDAYLVKKNFIGFSYLFTLKSVMFTDKSTQKQGSSDYDAIARRQNREGRVISALSTYCYSDYPNKL